MRSCVDQLLSLGAKDEVALQNIERMIKGFAIPFPLHVFILIISKVYNLVSDFFFTSYFILQITLEYRTSFW